MTQTKITPVILSGGSGSRLWPLSRKAYPKQFLKLHSEKYSLFQQTIMRTLKEEYNAPIIVTNDDHHFLVEEQLAALNINDALIILEPAARNTAAAIALTLALLDNKLGRSDEYLLMLPCDHVIGDVDLFDICVQGSLERVEQGALVTFGVTPTRPETGYGYIEAYVEEKNKSAYDVKTFVEKPNFSVAQSYIEKGNFYWNAGILLFKAQSLIDEFNQYSPDILETCKKVVETSYVKNNVWLFSESIFNECPDKSLDYAVLEKSSKMCVTPYQGHWNDIGGFHALWEEVEKDENGNAIRGEAYLENSKNCFIWGESSIIGTIGVDNLVVVQTEDAMLVADRNKAQDVKRLYSRLKASNNRLVTHNKKHYYPWGAVEVIAFGEGYQALRVIINSNSKCPIQRYTFTGSLWQVQQGEILFTRGADKLKLYAGQSAAVPVYEPHQIENITYEPVAMLVMLNHPDILPSREPVPVELLEFSEEGGEKEILHPNLHKEHYLGQVKYYPVRTFLKKILRKTPAYYPLLRFKRFVKLWKDYIFWLVKGKRTPPPAKFKYAVMRSYLSSYNNFIETGTFSGDTINELRTSVKNIYTIELDDNLYQKAQQRFSRYNNITCIRGDSADQLPILLGKIDVPTLFWLDSYYTGGITARGRKETPIRDELKAILQHKISTHTILIANARCFDGTHDYPTLNELKTLVQQKNSSYVLKVEHDIIHITPKEKLV